MKTLALILAAAALVACETSPTEKGTDALAQTSAAQTSTTAETPPAGAEAGDDEVVVTPLEHGSLILTAGAITIAVDPTAQAVAASEGEEPKADLILITHQHGDHLDPATISALRKEGAAVIVPAKVAEEAADALPNPTIMANGDSQTFLDTVTVEAVPMYNLERKRDNGEFFHPKGMGNGYVVTLAGKRIYVSGDTECTPEMKGLEEIDMAFVCMNLPYTMTPEEAATCIREFKPKKLYPYHFRGQDPAKLQSLLADVDEVEIVELDWYPNAE